jgi:serine/threonine protein kinase
MDEEDDPPGFAFTGVLGRGSFGLVKLARNLKTDEKVRN